MEDSSPTALLKELGLSKYAAETFLGLQRTGPATASDIAAVADVPRSQVYGAAEELEQLGLVNVQSANPKEFRAVSPSTAGDLLRSRVTRQTTEVVNKLEAMQDTATFADQADSEALWRIRGITNSNQQVIDLLESAESQILYYYTATAFLPTTVGEALEAAANHDRSVSVSVPTSIADESVPVPTGGAINFETVEPPAAIVTNCTRLLIIDDSAVLIGITTPQAADEELCFYSTGEQTTPPLAAAFRTVIHQQR